MDDGAGRESATDMIVTGGVHLALLAAGRGSRMGALTEDTPKALVRIGEGGSMLEINLRHIAASRLDAQVWIVGGYCWPMIARFAADHPPARALFNAHFDTAGPLRSLETALAAVPGNAAAVLIGNGDTIFAPALLDAVADDRQACALVVSRTDAGEPDDLWCAQAGDGRIVSAAKQADRRGAGLISAGLLAVRGSAAIDRLRAAIATAIVCERAAGRPLTWHNIVAELDARGARIAPITVPRTDWREFDSADSILRYRRESAAPGAPIDPDRARPPGT